MCLLLFVFQSWIQKKTKFKAIPQPKKVTWKPHLEKTAPPGSPDLCGCGWVRSERVHGEAVVFPVVSLEASGQWRTSPGMGSILAPGVNLPHVWSCPRCEPRVAGSTCKPSCSGKFCLAQGIWSSTKVCLGNAQALFWKEDICRLERQDVPISSHGTCTFKGRIAALLSAEQRLRDVHPHTTQSPHDGSESSCLRISKHLSWHYRWSLQKIEPEEQSLLHWDSEEPVSREWIPRLQETLKRC